MKMMTTEEKFRAAVKVIQNLPKDGSFQPSADMKLKFYSHFKQATEGPCNKPKPAFWDVIEKKKWEEWKKLGSMSKEEAMLTYVDELKKIVETMSYTDVVAEFIEVLGPFFEVAELDNPIKSLPANDEDEIVTNGNGNSDRGSDDYEKVEIESPEPVKVKKSQGIPIRNGHVGRSKSKRHDNSDGNFYSDHSDSENEEEEFSDPVEEDAASSYSSTKSFVECKDHIMEQPSDKHDENGDSGISETSYTGFFSLFTGAGRSSNPLKGKENPPKVERGGGDNTNGSGGGGRRSVGGRRGSDSISERRGASGSSYNPSRPVQSVGASGGEGGEWPHHSMTKPSDITEQIAVALGRLQRDMESVLTRLNTLEAITVAQHTSAQTAQLRLQEQMVQRQRPSWWPFQDVSFRTFMFFLLWPVVVQIFIKLWATRRLRVKTLAALIAFLFAFRRLQSKK